MASKTTHMITFDSGSAYAVEGGVSIEATIISPKDNYRTIRIKFDQWDIRILAAAAHKALDSAEQAIRDTRDALCGDEA